MRAIDALKQVPCVTGTIEADFYDPIVVLDDGGKWVRHEPGTIKIKMHAFEFVGGIDQAARALESLASEGFAASGANLSGWLYIRQPWSSDGTRVFGRYGMAIKCRPPASAATRKTSGA